jgi:ribose 5-phosphate isomerase B
MPDSLTVLPRTPKRIGVAADHGGFELKEYLAGMLREADDEVVDFGDGQPKPAWVRALPPTRCRACGPA